MEENKNITLPQNQPNAKKQKSRIWSVVLGSIGLIIVLAIIAIGAMLASHIWNPTWNPFEQHIDKGLKEKIFNK